MRAKKIIIYRTDEECCRTLHEAILNDLIVVHGSANYSLRMQNDNIKVDLNYCPFCGDRIEFEEEK